MRSPCISLTFAVLFLLLLGGVVRGAPAPDETAARVDRLLAEETLDEEMLDQSATDVAPIDVAPPANDETLLRRLTFDLVGRAPTPAEVSRFGLDPRQDKTARLVERLLADEQFGQNWAGYWRDVIMYRRIEDRALISSPVIHAYFATAINENRPWDEIARELITAEGDVRQDGRTAIIMAQSGRPEETVAELSRIFVGVQIQCAQCHDHPTDRWKREQFHELAAFFPRVAVRPSREPGTRTLLVVGEDRLPALPRGMNGNRFRGTLEHRMPDLDDPSAPGKVMQPVFFATGQKLNLGAADKQRRQSLARWITAKENPWFARAFVNRMWAELVGEGFYNPVDDMGPDRECLAPKTLDCLAEGFVASGHDVKWLFRTIVSTDAYRRASRDRRKPNQAPYAANCPQRLRADQIYNTLSRVLGFPAADDSSNPYALARGPRGVFNSAFGFDPSIDREEVAGAIPQALALMNSPIIQQALDASRPQSRVGQILRQTDNNEEAVVEVYLQVLGRQPKQRELQSCLKYFDQVDDRAEALEDIVWALINSTEFIHRN